MFHELFQIASHSTLSMLIAADPASGRMTISLTPLPRDKADINAPREPLTLTATPAEFDAEFITSLQTYRTALLSLREQTTAATARITAPRRENTAKTSSSKKTTPTSPNPPSDPSDDDAPEAQELQPDLFE